MPDRESAGAGEVGAGAVGVESGLLVGVPGLGGGVTRMSVDVMRNVWRYSGVDGTHLLALLALADSANSDGLAWPKVATIAEKCRLSERRTRTLISELVEAGEVEVRLSGRGRGHRSHYYVTCAAFDGPREKVPEPAGFAAGKGAESGRYSEGENLPKTAGKGVVLGIAYKGIEPSRTISKREIERVGSSSGEIEGEGGARVPRELAEFDEELGFCPGYQPTARFFEKVLEKYSGLDLVEQAMRIRGWFEDPRKSRGRVCTTGFVLSWLADEADPSRRERRRAGQAGRVRKGVKGGGNESRGGGAAGGLARFG